ncbi:lytic murein transglycosylase B [Paraglaciecola aestuariivivens]
MTFVQPKLLTFLLFFSLSSQLLAANAKQDFIELMVNQHGFEAQYIEQTLALANKNPDILKAISKPWEAKPWHQYYPIFLTDKRLSKGLEFWQTHQHTLSKVEQETGVPAQIIVAIIGVESFYGTYLGKYSVLDALFTLGFHYPKRSRFFKSELTQLFLLAQQEQFDITAIQGSYAGAMGWGQFIPSSYRHYAIDYDQDGVRDLFNNPIDVIGSVANYFKQNGWKRHAQVAFKAQVAGNQQQKWLSKSLKPKTEWQALQQAGVKLIDATLEPSSKVKLLAFEQANNQEYWVGLHNFYVITRYNHSPLYAMAVYQFSQQLQAQFKPLQNQDS